MHQGVQEQEGLVLPIGRGAAVLPAQARVRGTTKTAKEKRVRDPGSLARFGQLCIFRFIFLRQIVEFGARNIEKTFNHVAVDKIGKSMAVRLIMEIPLSGYV